MAAQIIDGKAVSAKVKEEVRQEIEREGLDVGLAVVIVGDDPASRVYVNIQSCRIVRPVILYAPSE